LLAVAVNVTEVPAHVVVALADIATEGTTVGLTVSVMVLLVAVVGEAQVALLVTTQYMVLPFDNEASEYVLLVAPDTAEPFLNHW